MRTKLGGRVKSASAFGRTMQPESIQKLASYIYVDKALMLKLAETGMRPENVDQIRAILLLNQNPGFDISSPLDGYDAVVMEVATNIVEENMHLIEEEIAKAQAEALGIGPIEELPEEIEELPAETPEERTVRRSGVEPKDVLIPEKRRIVGKTGTVTYRSKSVAWRKRGQKRLSAQEQFLVARAGQPAAETQREYIGRFKVYRSKGSIRTKQLRLSKRTDLTTKESTTGGEGPSGGMEPR